MIKCKGSNSISLFSEVLGELPQKPEIFLPLKETLSITENTQPDELILSFGMNYFHIKHLCLTIYIKEQSYDKITTPH